MFKFITKVLSGVEVRVPCRQPNFFYSSLGKPCVYGPPLILVKRYLTTNDQVKDILDIFALLTVGQQFGKRPTNGF